MPVHKTWIPLTKINIDSEKDVLGVYEIANQYKSVIYIGKGRMKNRLGIHSRRMSGATFYRTLQMPAKVRCEQKERALQRAFLKLNKALPLHNKQLGGLD